MQPYCYRPLHPNTIRLLGLHDRTSPTFSGTLKTIDLSDAPEYYCLSYTWGTQSEDVEIQVDGQSLHVRPSLVHTLHRLQELRAQSDLKVDWVWIDRICINQDDVDERSEQVRCMGKVYSGAVRTIIWAGLDTDGSSAAWPLIDLIYTICKTENPHAKYLADIPFRTYSDTTHLHSRLPPWSHELWTHLRNLFTLPWFTRTWIIQEVALSAQDPLILHGQHVLYSWEKLGWAASWLRRNGYLRLPQIPDQLQNCDTISNIRRSRGRWKLDALLMTTSVKFKSTDQRDKVYGLLGLAAEIDDGAQGGVPGALVPDYNLSVWDVYRNVVLYFLRTHRSLPTLALASGIWGDRAREQHVNQYESLPTWVPNWSDCCVSNSEHTKGLSWLYYSTTGEATKLGFPEGSDASDGLPASVLEEEEAGVLRLEGLGADVVVSVVPYDEESEVMERQSILEAWRLVAQSSRAEDVEKSLTAFVKSSTAEQHRLSGKSAEQMEKDGAAYIMNAHVADSRPISGAWLEADESIPVQVLQAVSSDGDADSYFKLARNFCHNRSFIITSRGRCGISPLGTQVGDVVAVLFGGGVPYVIRRHEHGFLFVGESYVDGLMEGEAVQEWREGDLKEEVLRFY